MMSKFFKVILLILLVFLLFLTILSFRKNPEKISYGISFSKFHSDELLLPWKEVYDTLLNDIKVRKLRLSAHWPMIEPQKDHYSFEDLDYQIEEAKKSGAEVILAIGRRLPGWPECHEPDWVKNLAWEEKKTELKKYIEAVVNRYKGYENIKYWEVENEPFLTVFAKEHCGSLDERFLREEIELTKKLDPTREILITDSGNLGLWYGAWKHGDVFGTSVYMYLWNPTVGKIKSVYWPFIYKLKTSLMEVFFGSKKSFLIELSLEPFLTTPIVNTSLENQLDRMDMDKFNEVLGFAQKTGFDTQYLWGAEWWYYMKTRNHPEFLQRAKELFE